MDTPIRGSGVGAGVHCGGGGCAKHGSTTAPFGETSLLPLCPVTPCGEIINPQTIRRANVRSAVILFIVRYSFQGRGTSRSAAGLSVLLSAAARPSLTLRR